MPVSDAQLVQMLQRVRLLAVDVDGTLTDGRLWYGADGEALKSFHVHDGLGLKRVMQAGISVAVVTARTSTIVERRMRDLGVEHVLQAAIDKAASMRELQARLAVTASDCAFVGDDVPDLSAFQECGLNVAVANARAEVKAQAHWVTEALGGHGAVREVCDRILQARALAGMGSR